MVGGKGFTLLELLVVMVVLAVAAAMAPPLMRHPPALKAATRELAAGLTEARGRAIAANREMLLTLDVERRRWWVGDDAHDLPKSAALRLYTARDDLSGASIGAIRFFPDGTSTGGQVLLREGTERYRLEVDWLTGRVKVE